MIRWKQLKATKYLHDLLHCLGIPGMIQNSGGQPVSRLASVECSSFLGAIALKTQTGGKGGGESERVNGGLTAKGVVRGEVPPRGCAVIKPHDGPTDTGRPNKTEPHVHTATPRSSRSPRTEPRLLHTPEKNRLFHDDGVGQSQTGGRGGAGMQMSDVPD